MMAGMRGLLPAHRAVAIVAGFVCVLSDRPVLHAQAGYLSLVHGFIDGRTNLASEMAKLPREAIDAGLRACLGKDLAGPASCRPQELRSAAILHADAIDFLVRKDPSQAAFQVQAGARMLRPLEKLEGAFVSRWYAYVARIYLASRDLITARSVAIDGLSRFESPDLYLARGMIVERQALARIPHALGAMLERRLNEGLIPNTLALAIQDYLRALSIDPGHTGARLRLTWIRLLQRDGRAWDDAAGLLRASTDPEARYLALLFRGAIAERDRSLAEAIHDFEDARREDVDTQTACVALSHAYSLAGDLSRSATVAAECLARNTGEEVMDPWWPFDAGMMDLTTTKWLHDHAVQP
jgi:tetratricopeptide (TPR) repeat protein